jgi:hypothetical protein
VEGGWSIPGQVQRTTKGPSGRGGLVVDEGHEVREMVLRIAVEMDGDRSEAEAAGDC